MSSSTGEAHRVSSSSSVQPCHHFSFAEIQSATNDFDDQLVVGEGGFGKVYKGCICIEETSLVVAIKRLDSKSDQGAAEFRAEIQMLSKLRHCHLVSLIGFCDANKEMILIYEYMSHGTLSHHLHKANTPLNWVQRLKIAIGAARGLDYLHTGVGTQHGVIHRDIKSSNILLDENWEAMVSDFGLSKVGPTNQSISYVDASVKGTFGYLDPEYFYTRRLTRKTDVFAFGVVLFELLSGRRAVDISFGEEHCSLVRWAQKCVKDRKLDKIVDSNIRGTISPKCLKRFARVADCCLSNVLKERPSMTEVVASLQVLLRLQEKHDNSSMSLGKRFTWMLAKYLVLVTKQNSVVSTLSIERNSVSDKFPASPLRVPPSPGRFLMSPALDRVPTQKFSSLLRLGEGGFGTVYEAQLEDGLVFAIKQAKKEHFDALQSEFKCEVELLAKIDHRNLVKLLGYVDQGNKRFILTEFVPNGTLREHLDDIHGSFLDFSRRLEISIDIAHGLTYLHLYAEKQIIHQDVKSSNILLTETKRAKVANNPLVTKTFHLDTLIKETSAFRKFNDGEVIDLVDPLLKEGVDVDVFAKMLVLAFHCVAPTRVDRPDMKAVGEQLWAIRMDYQKRGIQLRLKESSFDA